MNGERMRNAALELWYFFVANARASAFGAFLLSMFLLTKVLTLPLVSRYDAIFIAAVVYQICALLLQLETPREFFVIFLFHILATAMELFKTHPAIGSWQYPSATNSLFILASVPLFTGFLYSAIGSYISRAFVFLKLRYERFPAYYHLWILAILIYINFFTHHYIVDVRYALFVYVIVVFYKTMIYFQVYKSPRHMPFLLAALLTAFFVWIAENIGTFTHIWLYPSQVKYWHPVSLQKVGSWFLLLILSFALVSLIYRDALRKVE